MRGTGNGRGNNCTGSLEHGNACGLCGKCMAELAKLKRMNRPKVGEVDLDHWEEAAEDPQHLEIIRLARVGLWAEVHSVEIDDGLRLAGKELPTARRRAFENALSKRPRR